MSSSVYYKGEKYTRNPKSKNRADRVYFKRIADGTSKYLHRVIWSDANGAIPKNHHIHHIDGNPLNNDLNNLECLSQSDHSEKHPYDEDRRLRQAAHLERIRPMTKVWHSSDEGRKWHSEHGKQIALKAKEKELTCLFCEKVFKTKAIHDNSAFCSNAHKSAYRRKMGFDNVEFTCKFCDHVFIANKYAKRETCSRSCANRLRHARKSK